MIKRIPAIALFLLTIPVASIGQITLTSPPVSVPPTANPASGTVVLSRSNSTAPTSGTNAAPKTSALLQEFLKTKFDRRPSVLLRELYKDAYPPKPEELEDTRTPATPPKPSTGAAVQQAALAEQQKQAKEQVAEFRRQATLGNWDFVSEFWWKFPAPERPKAYAHFLKQLQARPPAPRRTPGTPSNPAATQFGEKNTFAATDVLELAETCPAELDRQTLTMLGSFLRTVLQRGDFSDAVLALLETGDRRVGGGTPEGRRRAARLLMDAGMTVEAGGFLPEIEAARDSGEAEILNLLARHFMALHAKEKETPILEKAWTASQAVLNAKDVKTSEKEEALERSLQLVPRLSDSLGEKWLDDAFGKEGREGFEVLSTIGAVVAKNRSNYDNNFRLEKLELQKQATEALLEKTESDPDARWQPVLSLLAQNWLVEADFSSKYDQSTQRGPVAQWDPFGNVYFTSPSMQRTSAGSANNRRRPQPIPSGKLLDILPSDRWLQSVDLPLRPRFDELSAKLFLRVKQEEKAFPHIERLAARYPERAKELANEFVDVWARNHDPNQKNRYQSRYMYVYGYNQRADSIPLTRSKQVRNLTELSEWVRRFKAMPVELEEDKLVNAFMTSHSTAEVYRLEDLQRVLGDMQSLKPESVSKIVKTMVDNLAGVWRKPETQEKNQTKRKDAEINEEVRRGYEMARDLLNEAIEAHPGNWALKMADGIVRFDENSFETEQSRDPAFTANREEAMVRLREAAQLYAEALPSLKESEHTTEPHETWFYASLGSTSLAGLKHEQQVLTKEQPKIRAALEDLPAMFRENHLARFANALNTRVSSVKAELKHRYLKAGLAIVGDHENAREVKDLLDYYKDVVSEIQLITRIDGDEKVGDRKPFGLFVEIRHTTEIERESGGFGRYLQNQANAGYYYNYGRPQTNYRDVFEEAARSALEEHFEVMSVTFHDEKIESRGDEEDGWRVTPYCYVLMKTLGPEVDTIPPLKLDLDFNDTSGFVVLPIESPALVIDAASTGSRPLGDLKITQTLDERRLDEGHLGVEVKANAKGLIPELDKIVDPVFPGFDVERVQDGGLAVMKVNAEGDEVAAESERIWNVSLKANRGTVPESFQFPRAKSDEAETTWQRFVDADLEDVESSVALRSSGISRTWPRILAVLVVLVLAGALTTLLVRKKLNSTENTSVSPFALPSKTNALSVLHLLQRIEKGANLSESDRAELRKTIGNLHATYFADESESGNEGDLENLARNWLAKIETA